MEITTSRWAESSVAIERGPLVFALKIEEEWKRREDKDRFGVYYEVSPKTDWNYGLLREDCENPNTGFTLIAKTPSGYPWTPDRAPLMIKARAKQIPSWQLYNHMAGPLPHSAVHTEPGEKQIILLPYGCTTLRITQFPALD